MTRPVAWLRVGGGVIHTCKGQHTSWVRANTQPSQFDDKGSWDSQKIVHNYHPFLKRNTNKSSCCSVPNDCESPGTP